MICYRKVRRYCYEDISNIENYDKALADKEHTWHCHHRNETVMNCGKRELIAKGAYFDRPARELVFLTKAEHLRLHHTDNKYWCGKSHSDDTKRKISEKKRGKDTLSLEARRKMSASLTNRQDLSTPIEMSRMSDGFTKVFPSQSEAVRWLKLNGYHKANVSKVSECANGHRKTAYNATWRNP